MDAARLILDYIKTLIWPVILLVALFSYEDDVINLLKNREIDAFGLKIGKRIEDISKNYETEIAELKESIEDTNGNKALLSKIESIDKNIKKELSLVQRQSQDASPAPVKALSRREGAARHERLGFEAMLNRDISESIVQFSAARATWPEYHNVAEIEKLLRAQRSRLREPNDWKQVYQLTLNKYSWGMPSDLRTGFKRALSDL